MARTLRYSDALTVVSKRFPKALEDNFAALASNLATNEAWMKYDFRETQKTLPPFYLIPNEQDHGPPFSIVPTDFLGLRQTYLTRIGNGSAGTGAGANTSIQRTTIEVVKDIPLTHVQGLPRDICYQPSAVVPDGAGVFRLFPRVPKNIGSPIYLIEATYKRRPTKITSASLDTLLPFDDIYFQTMVSGISWAMVALTQGGEASLKEYQPFGMALEQQATDEGLNLGDVSIHPQQPLVGSNAYTLTGFWGFQGIY